MHTPSEETLHFDLINKPQIVVEFMTPLTPRTYITRYSSLIEIEEELERRSYVSLRKPNLNISIGEEQAQGPTKVFHLVNPVNISIDFVKEEGAE